MLEQQSFPSVPLSNKYFQYHFVFSLASILFGGMMSSGERAKNRCLPLASRELPAISNFNKLAGFIMM